MNLKFTLNKRLKVSYVRNSCRKHLLLTNIKKTVKIFLILALLVLLLRSGKSLNLCTKLVCYNKTVQFFKNQLAFTFRR